MNPRFPRANAIMMQEVIRATHSLGEHDGAGFVSTLNKILDELNQRLRREVCRFNIYSIAFDSLRILDELYRRATQFEQQLAQQNITLPSKEITEDTKSMMQKIGVIEAPLERVVETVLAVGSSFSYSPVTKEGLLELFEIGYEMAEVHYCIESFLCLWKRGMLRVADSEWHFEPEEKDQNRSQNLMEKLAIERSQKAGRLLVLALIALIPENFKRLSKR